MKLSIIIPAYNAATYIETCLTSCVRQDLNPSDYEIIVVNDGSTDSTEALVTTYRESYPQIRLVTQENKGNGAARNTGVSNAKGDYIYFLDADDYIAENALGTLMGHIEKHALDFLGFSSKNVSDSDQKHSLKAGKDVALDPVMDGIDFLGIYNYKAEVWWYMVNRAFYLESGVSFYDRKFVQDSYLTPTLISKARRAAYTDYDVHRYRQSQNSITRRKSADHLHQHFKDLSFSVEQLYNLRKSLINSGVTNESALRRLHVKQQRYVFIIIVRALKSGLQRHHLKKMLTGFQALEAYPMDIFMTTTDYRSPVYRLLTFIFNRPYLLYPALRLYRLLRP